MKTLSFDGNGWEYFKIWIVNILLTLITLGIYYPWAKVRNRRYFYANSSLEGRNFEYHATGKQIFMSYLFALALFVAYAIIQQITPIVSLLVLPVIVLGIPWVIWRSLKFNLRMTSFSNVRFSFDGELGQAYVNYMLLPIVFFLSLYLMPLISVIAIPFFSDSMGIFIGIISTVLVIGSLGLAFYLFALIKKRNTIYGVSGIRFGQGRFAAYVETKKFAIILLKTMGIGILVITVFILIVGVALGFAVGAGETVSMLGGLSDPEAMKDILSGGILAIIGIAYFAMIAASFLILAYSYTRQRTYVLENSALDEKITFASTLTAKSLALVMITNLFIIVFSFGLALPWAKVRMTRLILENTMVNTDVGFDQYITEKQEEQSSLGDQIADAFDVDFGVGV